jgi:hypothetical protein
MVRLKRKLNRSDVQNLPAYVREYSSDTLEHAKGFLWSALLLVFGLAVIPVIWLWLPEESEDARVARALARAEWIAADI